MNQISGGWRRGSVLRTLAAPAENLGSILITGMTAHNHLTPSAKKFIAFIQAG